MWKRGSVGAGKQYHLDIASVYLPRDIVLKKPILATTEFAPQLAMVYQRSILLRFCTLHKCHEFLFCAVKQV